jgi:hypothetical protein
MINLIGVSGRAGSGKDTVGKIIQYLVVESKNKLGYLFEFNKYHQDKDLGDYMNDISEWQIRKFAYAVKQICSILTGIPIEDFEKEEVKSSTLGEEWKQCFYMSSNETKILLNTPYPKEDTLYKYHNLTVRELLQTVGTDAMRDVIHPDCWTIALFKDYIGDIEIWKDIKEYKGKYQISNFGRIKGLDRKIVYGNEYKGEYHTKKESILKSTVSGKYEMIKLEGNNSVLIHKLVAEYFLPTVKKDKPYINHIDQNPLNNFYKNLEWCTQSENVLSANKAGNGNVGEKQFCSKLTEKQVKEIRKLIELSVLSLREIAKMYNVGTTTISDIKLNKKWKYIDKIKPVTPILPVLCPNWIITDLRFPNEAKAIKDRQGIVIRVNRYPKSIMSCKPGEIPVEIPFDKFNKNHIDLYKGECLRQHESETSLDNYTFDYVIENDSDIPSLIEKVREMLIHFKLL